MAATQTSLNLRTIDVRGAGTSIDYRTVVGRAAIDVGAAEDVVRPILDDVASRGAAAVLDYAERFDGLRPPSLRVPSEVIAAAEAGLDPQVRAGLQESIRRARIGHAAQQRTDCVVQVVPGGTVTQRWVPVRRVGLYVPGGRAVYPSSVVMNVVPAQTAGVESLAVVSPGQRDFDGWPHPTVLAACALLGIDEVYAVGGAQAVAMLAHGVRDGDGTWLCEPVDVITGPGNVYVTAAKRLVRGLVGIDAEAGPTEIAVLADHTADAAHIAADLISQAEHDPLAGSVLVTDSVDLAARVLGEVRRQAAVTRHRERVLAALNGPQSSIVLVDDIDQGLRVVDGFAAEHLEVQCEDAAGVAARVRNAGAIFVGPWTPVSLGDYCAGSNHVLPTGGCARHTAGLGVDSFLRSVQVVEYTRPALEEVAGHVLALSAAEDLPAHGAAVAVRVGTGTAGESR